LGDKVVVDMADMEGTVAMVDTAAMVGTAGMVAMEDTVAMEDMEGMVDRIGTDNDETTVIIINSFKQIVIIFLFMNIHTVIISIKSQTLYLFNFSIE